MANEVKWIKFKVGTFDGMSFKKIKRAKIDGVMNFRDKLTAVWFELLDLGGKVNNNGFLINDELAFITYEDIAIALDRTEDEIKMCLNWFIENNMMEIIDNIYLISNWSKYQNVEGLEKIQERNRIRQQRYRDNKKMKQITSGEEESNTALRNDDVTPLKDNNISLSNSELSNTIIKDTLNDKDKDLKDLKEKIIDYTNSKLGTNYRYQTKSLNAHINARISEGYTFDDFKYVIDLKYNEWHDDPQMSKYLRYDTLFGTKFEVYRNQKPSKTNHQKPTNLTKAQFEELEQITRNKTSKMFGGIK